MPFGIGHWELVLLAVVVLLLFGTSRLPRLGRQLGRGTREARREYLEVKRSFELREEPEGPTDGERARTEPPLSGEDDQTPRRRV